jgi:uncharacterized membrane protein
MKTMKTKILSASIMLMLLIVSLVPITSAEDNNEPFLYIEQVRINGDVANDDDTLYVERGDDINIRVVLQANEEVRYAYMGAYLSGYRYAQYEPDMVIAHTPTFNIPAENKRSFDLDLKIPVEIQQKDAKLRLVIFDENSGSIITYNYQLAIYGSDEKAAVQVRNFFISPSDTIEAGRALSFKVQVRNYGNFDLDDVTVKVAIPELGIQTFETIDSLRVDETQSFESLLLRIPQDATAGTYEVVATVEYDRFQSTKQSKFVTITKSDVIESGKDGVSVVTMPESVQVVAGTQDHQGSLYPILIENKGASSKTYVLSVSGHESWATATFEPSSVLVVQGGKTQTAYLRLLANDDVSAGDKILKVSVASGDDVKETTVLASVVVRDDDAKETSWDTRQILEWALVVLIIVLIILGLIVVFRKMRRNKDDEDEQTYY